MVADGGSDDQAGAAPGESGRIDPGAPEWRSGSFGGFEALALGHRREAAEAWIKAGAIAASMVQSDPRAAAAQNNRAVGHLLLSQTRDARDEFNGALVRWTSVRRHMLGVEVPVVGASSVFHLKLTMNHHDAFRENRRQRYVQLCEAAMAITSFNVRLLGWHIGDDSRPCSDNAATLASLAAAFGDRCPEISIIRKFESPERSDGPPFAEHGEKVKRIRNLQVPSLSGSFSTDCRNLELAAHLTALLDPRLLHRDQARIR